MKDKGTDHRDRGNHLVLFGIGLGGLYWIVESLIDVFIFHMGNLFERMFTPDGNELWMRLLIMGIFTFFGLYAQHTKEKQVEERLRLQITALESAANAIVITDSKGYIIWVNHAFTKLTGYKSEEVLGQNPRILKSGRHDESFYKDLWKTILAGQIWNGEVVNRRKDGSLYVEEQTITPVRDEHGDISHFIAVKQDIAERKQNEEKIRIRIRRQEAIAKLAQRTLSDIDLSAFVNEAASIVAQTLEVEYCKIFEFVPEDNTYLLWAGVSRMGEQEGHAIVGIKTNLPDKYTLSSKDPVIVEEIGAETYIKEPSLFYSPGVVSYINVVIHGQDQLIGVLGAYTTRERRFEKDDINFLQAIANILAEGIERKRTERALQASETNFRRLLESAPDAIVIVNREGNIVLVNAQADKMFGYKREELHGKSIETLVPKSFWEGYVGYQTEYYTDPRIISVNRMEKEAFARRKNKSEFSVDIRLSPMETEDGIMIISTIRDITERKKAEEEHIQLIREQTARTEAEAAWRHSAFLAEASAILDASLDHTLTLKKLARFTVPFLADLCIIDIVGEDGLPNPLAIAHVDPSKEDIVRRIRQLYPPDPSRSDPVIKALKSGQPEFLAALSPLFLEKIAKDTEHLRLLRDLDPRSAMFVPFLARGKALGAITFISGESDRHYNQADLILALELGRRCAMAVDNARLYQSAQQEIAERRRAEEEVRLLQTLTLDISESQDIHSALGVVLRKVCEATGWVLGQAWIPIHDGTLLNCSPAWYSSVSGLEEFRILSEGFTFPPGIGLPGSAWSVKKTFWMRDVTESTNFPRIPIARKVGIKGGLAIPIFAGDEVGAVIEFFMLEPREGDERVERLVSSVATQLSSVIRRHQAEEDLRIKTGQLVAVMSAMTVLIESRNWQEASAIILRCVLTQTESEYGFIGVLTKGPALRILSFEGIIWDKVIGHEFYENALSAYHKVGYLEFTNLEHLFGKVITSKKAVISNNPATDPRSKGLPPGHPPLSHFLGVPILREKEVVGMIGVANRQGGYGGTEQSKIEILSRAAAVLCDTYRRHKK